MAGKLKPVNDEHARIDDAVLLAVKRARVVNSRGHVLRRHVSDQLLIELETAELAKSLQRLRKDCLIEWVWYGVSGWTPARWHFVRYEGGWHRWADEDLEVVTLGMLR